jgi:glucosamine--fructose-6-phosphate aminotransferase (isomerizing)
MGIKNGESKEMNKFLTEIFSQPDSLKATLDFYTGVKGETLLKNFSEFYKKEKFDRIIFTGMGSSYFVSYSASCLFNSLGFQTSVINTSELLYYQLPTLKGRPLLVCISQSGESIEVVRLLKVIPSNVTCIGIGNEENSSLASMTREIFLSRAGKEEMTSTKTFTSITLVAYILGWYLAGKWNNGKARQVKELIAAVNNQLSHAGRDAENIFEFFGDVEFLQFIGRGPSYANVLQSELMFKEASKTAAAGALGGEFRHGPMEMVGPAFKAVLFAADGETYQLSLRMAKDIVKFDGKVVVITNKNDECLNDNNIKTVLIDQPEEYLFTIQSIIPVQLMVNYLSEQKGYEPGGFIHGNKVTTAE